MPKALVIRAAGTNCDAELCRAFEMAGAGAELVHLDSLCRRPAMLGGADLVGFPGGFSFGDDIASGRVFAMKVRERLYPALRDALGRGALVIGVCNGFQVLVQVGLLPGPETAGDWPGASAPVQSVALTDNERARYHDGWFGVAYEPRSVCLWTRGLAPEGENRRDDDVSRLPVAHGEGRFVAASSGVLAALDQRGQIAVRYTDNFNGSQGSIAGICDASGQVFGLMPHPERYLEWSRHPYWTRLDADVRKGVTPGLRMFQNAVECVASGARR